MKKCKNLECRKTFQPFNSTQKVCSVSCAIALAKTDVKKTKQKTWNKRKAKLKDQTKNLSQWKKEVQTIFNSFIRLRDTGKPCISCNNLDIKKKNAGHYKSVGSHPEMRFEELNCHLQCEHCNTYLSGNLIPYRKNLINRIGTANVEWLEENHDPKKYTIDDLKELKQHYKDRLKEIH